MKLKKNVLSIMVLIVFALTLVACGGEKGGESKPADKPAQQEADKPAEAEADKPAEKVKVGSVILNTSGEWFSEVINGMKDAAADLDVDLQIASAENDVSKEADQLDNFIAQGVDAVCVSPQNSTASIPAFERVVAAGIPIVAWNTDVESEKSKYFVGVDNYSLGSQTGEYAVKYINENMGGKAKIAVIGIHKYEIGMDRVNGFLDAIKNEPGIEVIANQDAELKEEGMTITENILQAHPEIDLIWAWNQTSMEGAVAALLGGKRVDIPVMGTDMSVDIAKHMLADNAFLAAVTTQQPYEIGYTAVKNAAELARSGNVDSEVLVPLMTYTIDDKDAVQQYIDDRVDLIK